MARLRLACYEYNSLASLVRISSLLRILTPLWLALVRSPFIFFTVPPCRACMHDLRGKKKRDKTALGVGMPATQVIYHTYKICMLFI